MEGFIQGFGWTFGIIAGLAVGVSVGGVILHFVSKLMVYWNKPNNVVPFRRDTK